MALKLGKSIELWAWFSELHSESPVFFQNTGKIARGILEKKQVLSII